MGVAFGGLASLLHAGMGLTAQAPDTTRRDSAVVLPPVTIAATRSERELFALPLAVSRVKPHTWFGTSGSGLSDALGLVPGVVSQSRAGGTDVRITIRGFGARGAGDRSNSGTTRGIRVLLDGFPETEPDGRTSLDGIDLAAAHGVEVVRSNSSAVWGNAAGGVLSVSTVPETEGRLLDGEAMAGSFALWRWALRGGVALGPGRALASVTRTEFGGWREHSASDRSLVNLAFVTPPGHRTTVGVFAVGSDNFFEIPGPLTAAQVAADPAQANSTYAQRNERRHNRVARLGATFDHQATRSLGLSGMLYINPKYLQRSERGTFRDFTRYHLGGNVVARVATPLGSGLTGTLQVGVDAAYQDGAILFYSLTPEGGRGDTLRADQREGASNLGVFLQEELALGERWAVTLGARWDDITYRAEDFLAPDLAARKSFQRLSPKL
ncbi:MAG: TonB-dependent receptor, partial [Gemmatimonadales bacterium]